MKTGTWKWLGSAICLLFVAFASSLAVAAPAAPPKFTPYTDTRPAQGHAQLDVMTAADKADVSPLINDPKLAGGRPSQNFHSFAGGFWHSSDFIDNPNGVLFLTSFAGALNPWKPTTADNV